MQLSNVPLAVTSSRRIERMARKRKRPLLLVHSTLLIGLYFGTLEAFNPDIAASAEHSSSRVQHLRTELASKPDDFQTLVTLATTLHELDHSFPDGGKRVAEAEDAYRRAIKVAPTKEYTAILVGNLGALLMSAGRLKEALREMDGSIELSASIGQFGSESNVGAIFNRGKALGMLGQEVEAEAAYRQAMQESRGNAPGTWTKACASLKNVSAVELKDMEAAATFLTYGRGIAAHVNSRQHAHKQMEAAMLQEEWGWMERTDPSDSCWLFFALFSAFDSKGAYDKAWAYLATANKQQRTLSAEGSSRDSDLLQALTSIFRKPEAGFDADTYEALLAGTAGYPNEAPIFIVGMPRSGSTLIEQILASHPAVFGAGEDTALAPLMPALFNILGGDTGQISLKAIAHIGERYIQEMRQRVPDDQHPTRIVDKMLRNAWNLGHISFILPKAKVVWAIRHPLDVVLSCFAQPFEGRGTPWASSLDEIVQQLELTHQIMEHWESLLPLKILRMPYEDVVADLEGSSRRLLQFSGLPWNPAVLEFQKARRPVQTASLSQVRKKLYRSSVGKWKRYAKHLVGVRKRLKPLIRQYERDVKNVRRRGSKSEEL